MCGERFYCFSFMQPVAQSLLVVARRELWTVNGAAEPGGVLPLGTLPYLTLPKVRSTYSRYNL
jgi:hypothetical protein